MVVFTDDASGGNCCAVQCKHCSLKFLLSNPAAATADHSKRCSKHIHQQPRRSPRVFAGSNGSRTLTDEEGLTVKKKLAKGLTVKANLGSPALRASLSKARSRISSTGSLRCTSSQVRRFLHFAQTSICTRPTTVTRSSRLTS